MPEDEVWTPLKLEMSFKGPSGGKGGHLAGGQQLEIAAESSRRGGVTPFVLPETAIEISG